MKKSDDTKKSDDSKQKLILKSVSTSKQEIEDAERHLSKVLQGLGAAPRAQKTTISGVVQTAFDRLRSARESLDKLEKLIKGSSSS
jgi:tRNA C32,U32 (ribose-2'-O)-methylase TrmJ